jgi:hypothetical protein
MRPTAQSLAVTGFLALGGLLAIGAGNTRAQVPPPISPFSMPRATPRPNSPVYTPALPQYDVYNYPLAGYYQRGPRYYWGPRFSPRSRAPRAYDRVYRRSGFVRRFW